MTRQDIVLDEIGQILVPIRDVERAVAFYRDRLGMRFLYQFPGMAFFDCGGIRLYLSVPENASFRGKATIYYRVANVAAAVAALEARGVVFDDRPHVVHRDDQHELWMAFFRDPDDNNLALMAELPLASSAEEDEEEEAAA